MTTTDMTQRPPARSTRAEREAFDRRVRAERERAEAAANHVHSWKNWEYVMDFTHEVRECGECGFAEIQPVRF